MRWIALSSLALAACAPSWRPTTQCLAEASLTEAATPDLSADASTRIHAHVAADTTGAWIAYNAPDDDSAFDVLAAHVACDGSVDVAPVQVDASDDNEIDPAVAVHGDTTVVAWQADTGVFPNNLSIRWRVLGPDGTPQGDVHTLPTSTSAWFPDLTATADGFTLVGLRADDDLGLFRTFVARLGPDGLLVDDPVDLTDDPGEGEGGPKVAVAEDGTEHVAFVRTDVGAFLVTDGTETLVQADADAIDVDASPDGPWLAWSTAGYIHVQAPDGDDVTLTDRDATRSAPTIAVAGDGAHVAWLAQVEGFIGRLEHVGVSDDGRPTGGSQAAGGKVPIPYGLDLARADDDTVVLGWARGDNPVFDLRVAWWAR